MILWFRSGYMEDSIFDWQSKHASTTKQNNESDIKFYFHFNKYMDIIYLIYVWNINKNLMHNKWNVIKIDMRSVRPCPANNTETTPRCISTLAIFTTVLKDTRSLTLIICSAIMYIFILRALRDLRTNIVSIYYLVLRVKSPINWCTATRTHTRILVYYFIYWRKFNSEKSLEPIFISWYK